MELVIAILQQFIIMIILAGIGYIMFRSQKITLAGSKTLGNILIYLSLPCVIINGFLIERTPEHFLGLLYSAVAAIVLLFVAIIISRLIFKKDAIAVFAGSFSNAGFFGVPLIVASLSNGMVFYIASFIAFLNLLQWTYGVALMTQDQTGQKGQNPLKSLSFKRIATAPFMIAIVIGLFFFLTQLPMPSILAKSISFLSGLNTPIAMFTVGVYLAETDIGKMLRKPVLYKISAVRLLVIPLISILLLSLLPSEMADLKMAIIIAAACPVGSNVAVYAQLHDKDYIYSVETVIISTVLSLVSIPVVVGLSTFLWY